MSWSVGKNMRLRIQKINSFEKLKCWQWHK